MVCSQCQAEIPDASLYCLRCGAEQADRDWVPAPDHHHAGHLVTLATTHLLRQEYRQATETCQRAVEEDPGNAAAYSLLGDVCAAQGRDLEARQWYEIAISLHPRASDRQKLERLRRLEEQALTAQRAEELYGSRPWVRIAIYAAATLCLILILSALWILATSRRSRAYYTPVRVACVRPTSLRG